MVPRPEVDPVQNGSTGALQTTLLIAVSVLGPLRAAEIVEDGHFNCQNVVSGTCN